MIQKLDRIVSYSKRPNLIQFVGPCSPMCELTCPEASRRPGRILMLGNGRKRNCFFAAKMIDPWEILVLLLQ